MLNQISKFSPLPSSFVALDFETTGLYPHLGARIIEIGAVRVEGSRILDRWSNLVHTPSLPASISRLTGISEVQLRKAPTLVTLLPQICRFLGAGPIVAHRAAFERRFFYDACARCGLPGPRLTFICTHALAKTRLPHGPSYRLADLCGHLGIGEGLRPHRAPDDAERAALLALALDGVGPAESNGTQ
ncbi:3'-5' exonuclease [Sulfidibacter corallicola]|uniref:3'-5' exonuclease n=1 Tax=Sulfidibacter corallicola TaxID=2818388 RepID=A0A8A4TKF0_SULCO|nr:3'-5' exonuclease [Sulfidibacter corallicola]QTD49308.1 3'-5' exonuclease [Sulfidibacter corallicola]